MVKAGDVGAAFQIYWDEMARCRSAKTYWALLHVTVCLPDICAALQAPNGETTGALYIAWCEQHLQDPILTGAERYVMRCKVLHQGRASIGHPGRYSGFSFAQPATDGQVDHRRVEGTTLVLDVGRLADEVREGVERWIQALESGPTGSLATNVEKNLGSLVRVRQFALPPRPGVLISVPLVITRSS